jgi:hypothetical protein
VVLAVLPGPPQERGELAGGSLNSTRAVKIHHRVITTATITQ